MNSFYISNHFIIMSTCINNLESGEVCRKMLGFVRRTTKTSSRICSVNSLCYSIWRNEAVSSSNPDDSDFIQESVVPTFHFQASLPRLPIPRLDDTKRRFLNAFEPIASSNEEYESATKAIDEFVANEGRRLHDELVELNQDNYSTPRRLDAYYTDRRSLVLTSNAAMVFEDDPRPEYNEQLVRAAILLRSSLRFMNSVRKNVLEPTMFHAHPENSNTPFFKNFVSCVPSKLSWYPAHFLKATPLDMSQFKQMFNSSRIPQLGRDDFVTYDQAKHIIVTSKGSLYVFDVIKNNGSLALTSDIYRQLALISAHNPPASVPPVSVLTSEERDTWTVARKQLKAANEDSLKLIESAILCLCLDDDDTDNLNDAMRNFLHGNGQNRWFDKSMQLVINKRGLAAIHFGMSWANGLTIWRYMDDVYRDSLQSSFMPDSKTIDSGNPAFRIEFKLDSELLGKIEVAKNRFEKRIADLSVRHVKCEKFGRNLIKAKKHHGDALSHLAMLAAYYNAFGCFPSAAGHCSTAGFKSGRTELVRSLTREMGAVIKALWSGDERQLGDLVKKASLKHVFLIREARRGEVCSYLLRNGLR
ncbi:carnitine O-palmitoyltransferase 2, mitochondrial-like [Oscarella lobularis]|uniref:carnitine O-palmitoyltransferase 2, mitochondrial-like n=1 Tax=Oscarella lobularis TaxID=121494 RepID=UPI003313F496